MKRGANRSTPAIVTAGCAKGRAGRPSFEAFHYTQGEPQVYRSSARGERRFCPKCGGQIEFRERNSPTSVSVNLGTLDDPKRIEPTFHIWVESRIAWFETADALPRYPEHGPEE
jgi:hypothetical protein